MAVLNVLGWLVLGAWAVLTVVRVRLAAAVLAAEPRHEGSTAGVSIWQPIRSGDPALAERLASNLAANPGVNFRWLVDSEDAEAIRVCRDLTGDTSRVEVIEFDPAPEGVNPKVFKLAAAGRSEDTLIALLDDDTVLPAGALARAVARLEDAELITGLPCYETTPGLWSRLVAGFVNSQAVITYLPPLAYGPPVTINGMFFLTTADSLAQVGGFGAIQEKVCDDYELALAYRRAGLRIAQTGIGVRLRTTVPDSRAYYQQMRRWLVFSLRLLRSERSAALRYLVVVPAVLPLVVLLLSLITLSAPLALGWAAVTLGRALSVAWLRRRVFDDAPSDWLAEVAADLLQPLHAVIALASRGRIIWRGRPMRIGPDGGLA